VNAQSEVQTIVKEIQKRGWRVRLGRHYRAYPPGGGRPITIPVTPSDRRAMKYIRSDIRRAERVEE